jgi:hypothetical protein
MPFKTYILDDGKGDPTLELVWVGSDGETLTVLEPENPVEFFTRSALDSKCATTRFKKAFIILHWYRWHDDHVVKISVSADANGFDEILHTNVHGEAEYNSFIAAFTKLVEYCEKK